MTVIVKYVRNNVENSYERPVFHYKEIAGIYKALYCDPKITEVKVIKKGD